MGVVKGRWELIGVGVQETHTHVELWYIYKMYISKLPNLNTCIYQTSR